MRPFQIYRLQVRFNNCEDARPWLVMENRPNDLYACLPISTRNYGSSDVFPLDPAHPDFPATGLTRPCFILCERIFELEGSRFQLDGKQQLKGELLRDLQTQFRRHMGI